MSKVAGDGVDWEKRAQELRHEQWRNATPEERRPESWQSGPWEIRAALQLGREMADEARLERHRGLTATEVSMDMERERQLRKAAADARAEEIAQAIESSNLVRLAKEDLIAVQDAGIKTRELRDVAARIARSTIRTAPAAFSRILTAEEAQRWGVEPGTMCMWDGTGFEITSKPAKDRERALEEALREIAGGSQVGSPGLLREEWSLEKQERSEMIARRALEWRKP